MQNASAPQRPKRSTHNASVFQRSKYVVYGVEIRGIEHVCRVIRDNNLFKNKNPQIFKNEMGKYNACFHCYSALSNQNSENENLP